MKPFQANILNAVVLVAMGLWGYLSATDPSMTALIPVIFGILFLIATPPFKNDNKVVAHIIVLLTFILIIMLIMPLRGAMGREDTLAMTRIGIMMAVGIFALVIFIKSFIDVRKAKANK